MTRLNNVLDLLCVGVFTSVITQPLTIEHKFLQWRGLCASLSEPLNVDNQRENKILVHCITNIEIMTDILL